jgi:hypothetical protein
MRRLLRLQRFHNCCTPKPQPLSGFFLKKKPPCSAPERARELWNRSKVNTKAQVSWAVLLLCHSCAHSGATAQKTPDQRTVAVAAVNAQAQPPQPAPKVRIDTPQEIEYYKHGGILQYVLRQLVAK